MYILKYKDFKELEVILKDKFKVVKKSPYSLSIYNSTDIDWKYKPEGSYRISNHWNFKGHCKTRNDVSNLKLSIGRYSEGYYTILTTYDYEKYLDGNFRYGGYYIDGCSIKYDEFEINIEDKNNKLFINNNLKYIYCYIIGKREEDVEHEYLILEGNKLSLTNPDLTRFNLKYIGSFKKIIDEIVISKESDDEKISRIVRIGKNNPNRAVFKKYKNGKCI